MKSGITVREVRQYDRHYGWKVYIRGKKYPTERGRVYTEPSRGLAIAQAKRDQKRRKK